VVRLRSCRVIYYCDTPVLGIRHQLFDRVTLHYVPIEHYRIEKLRDGLQQELRQWLIAFKFETTKELIEMVEALKACMREG